MQMINTMFLNIVEQSLTAGIIILIVIAVRVLLKSFPKSFHLCGCNMARSGNKATEI